VKLEVDRQRPREQLIGLNGLTSRDADADAASSKQKSRRRSFAGKLQAPFSLAFTVRLPETNNHVIIRQSG
jgi:hypothetical protein